MQEGKVARAAYCLKAEAANILSAVGVRGRDVTSDALLRNLHADFIAGGWVLSRSLTRLMGLIGLARR